MEVAAAAHFDGDGHLGLSLRRGPACGARGNARRRELAKSRRVLALQDRVNELVEPSAGGGPPPLPRLRATRDGDEKVWDYVVVEFMPGGSLADLLRDRAGGRGGGGGGRAPRRWPWRARLAVLCDVAEGMAQMHGKRYIHRDLKSDNILINAAGRAKVADLGLARSDEAFDVSRIASLEQRRAESEKMHWSFDGGTASYMSPDVIAEYMMKILTERG